MLGTDWLQLSRVSGTSLPPVLNSNAENWTSDPLHAKQMLCLSFSQVSYEIQWLAMGQSLPFNTTHLQ